MAIESLASHEKKAHRLKAPLVLIDESGFLMAPLVRRSSRSSGKDAHSASTGSLSSEGFCDCSAGEFSSPATPPAVLPAASQRCHQRRSHPCLPSPVDETPSRQRRDHVGSFEDASRRHHPCLCRRPPAF